MAEGQVMAGASPATTMRLNEPLVEFPFTSYTVTVTGVVPTLNSKRSISQLSVAVIRPPT